LMLQPHCSRRSLRPLHHPRRLAMARMQTAVLLALLAFFAPCEGAVQPGAAVDPQAFFCNSFCKNSKPYDYGQCFGASRCICQKNNGESASFDADNCQ
jgi:hypothetical protein